MKGFRIPIEIIIFAETRAKADEIFEVIMQLEKADEPKSVNGYPFKIRKLEDRTPLDSYNAEGTLGPIKK